MDMKVSMKKILKVSGNQKQELLMTAMFLQDEDKINIIPVKLGTNWLRR